LAFSWPQAKLASIPAVKNTANFLLTFIFSPDRQGVP
jgi:hypothetical protein